MRAGAMAGIFCKNSKHKKIFRFKLNY
jgi:hypothetical protein